MSRSYLYTFIKKEPTLRRAWEQARALSQR
jgi:hypothetical protein